MIYKFYQETYIEKPIKYIASEIAFPYFNHKIWDGWFQCVRILEKEELLFETNIDIRLKREDKVYLNDNTEDFINVEGIKIYKDYIKCFVTPDIKIIQPNNILKELEVEEKKIVSEIVTYGKHIYNCENTSFFNKIKNKTKLQIAEFQTKKQAKEFQHKCILDRIMLELENL
jgi:hypothetical protein